jgi:hypothetical protein
VGNPLRQTLRLGFQLLQYKIAIFRQKRTFIRSRHKNLETHYLSSLFLFVLGFPSTNPGISFVDVGEVLDFVASSLDQHKHKARVKKAGSLILLQRGILGFTHKT